ncbi:HD domain-containing phosphohydrolase [Clostridium sp.]|uniref:HD-GYP domain-containing protein n=1 Tax=Clostridium sp. TaxID=1506 RepID=UPI0032177839
MNISMKNIVSALSLSLDLTDNNWNKFENILDIPLKTSVSNHEFSNHSKCTCYIALEIARALNLDENSYYNLYIACMIHDIGTQNIFDKSHNSNWHIKKHCIEGSEMIQTIPSLIQVYDIIRYHHENFDGSGCLNLQSSLIPIEAQILRLADLVEIQIDFDVPPYIQKPPIINWVISQSGILFSPDIVDVFLKISNPEAFWLNLLNIPTMDFILDDITPKKDTLISLGEFEAIADVFANIIDNKSSFTATHSKEIATLAYDVSKHIGYDEEKCLKMKIAGLLHDIGKLAIPISILDKDGPLTEDEFSIIKSHTYYTKLILDKIDNISDISFWASSHHEKLNGLGYPRRLSDEQLSEECRIIGVCDIYQSLTADRPYRNGLYMYQAFDILDDMVSRNLICSYAVNQLKDTLVSQVESNVKLHIF